MRWSVLYSKKMPCTFECYLVGDSLSPIVGRPAQLKTLASHQQVQATGHPHLLPGEGEADMSPTSLLMRRRGQSGPTLSTSEAKGWTTRLVPRIISKSHLGKSALTHWKNLSGRFSPKNTMSGLTRPPQEVQDGTTTCYNMHEH